MEVVIILGNVGEDAQPVWNPQSNHIFCIQQGWDPQLLLCHSKCLEMKQKRSLVQPRSRAAPHQKSEKPLQTVPLE